MIRIIKKNLDLLPVLIILTFAIILSSKKQFSLFTLDGIKMYFGVILPSLFPFIFITTLLSFCGGTLKIGKLLSPITTKLFKLNGVCGYAYFMSLISGCPIGASIVSTLKSNRLISQVESERCSVLCSTFSPSYLISTVGGIMFDNVRFGLLLFVCHLLSSITIGIIFSFYKKEKPTPLKEIQLLKSDNIIYDGIVSTINSVLFVGGIITIFYIISEVLFNLKVFNPLINLGENIFQSEQISKALIFGILENSKGLITLSQVGAQKTSFILCACLCGFGGLSVILQSVAFLKKAKIKIAPFILSKIMIAIINLIYSTIISLLFL